MTYVVCTVRSGLRPTEATVAVQELDGGKAFLRVERDFIREHRGKTFLPVGVIHADAQRVLIELPHEADSGLNRFWVHPRDVQYVQEKRGAMA